MTSIAKPLNAKLRGWIAYYGKYSIRSLRNTLMMIDRKLIKWLRRKHKIGYRKSVAKLNMIKQANPALFYHWKNGILLKRIKNNTEPYDGRLSRTVL